MDWQRDYDARDWQAVENWWRRTDDLAALTALLAQLHLDVPKRVLRNGVDERRELLRAKDAPDEWRGAAAILEMGELEARVAGEPASDIEIWADQHSRLAEELMELAAAAEETKGDMELSRRAHAERALEALERVNKSVAFRLGLYRPDEQEALRELAAEVAINALRAGYFSYAAESKSIQAHAMRGKLTVASAGAGGRSRAMQTKPKTGMILKRMRELKEAKSCSVSEAAKLARKEGLGTSSNANRQLWKNHRKK